MITRFDHAVIAVADLDRATEAYRALGFDVRGFVIDLLSPAGNGPVQEMLDRDGEGPFEVMIEVEVLATARLALSRVEFTENAARGELRPPTEASLGARLVFTKQA